MDKQSLSLNQVKAKLQTQRANQFSSSQVDGMGEWGVIKIQEKLIICLHYDFLISDVGFFATFMNMYFNKQVWTDVELFWVRI